MPFTAIPFSMTMAAVAKRSMATKAAVPRPPRGPALDEVGFGAFYGRTAEALARYLRGLASGDAALADDVLQESYMRLLQQPSLPSDERARTAYLYRTATNLLHDRWRRQRRERGWLANWLGNPPVTLRRRVDLELDLDLVLAELEPRQRALVWLAHVDGYAHREIAEILGLKTASVKVMLHRARRKLSAALERHGFDLGDLGNPNDQLSAATQPVEDGR